MRWKHCLVPAQSRDLETNAMETNAMETLPSTGIEHQVGFWRQARYKRAGTEHGFETQDKLHKILVSHWHGELHCCHTIIQLKPCRSIRNFDLWWQTFLVILNHLILTCWQHETIVEHHCACLPYPKLNQRAIKIVSMMHWSCLVCTFYYFGFIARSCFPCTNHSWWYNRVIDSHPEVIL